MGIFDGLLSAVAPALGSFFGGPIGGIIGSGIAGAIGGNQAAQGAENANAANWAMMQSNQQFSADQAQKQMAFQEEMLNQQFQRNLMFMNQAQDFNTYSQSRNFDFQRDMSSTAWQRGVKDMMAAGLNPMLAYSQGGASSPVGGMASVSPASAGTAAGAMGSGSGFAAPQNVGAARVSAALNTASTVAQVQNMVETNEKIKAERRNIDADTVVKVVTAPKVEQETRTSATSAGRLKAETDTILRNLFLDRPRSEVAKIEAERGLISRRNDIAVHELEYAPKYFRGRADEIANAAMLRGLEIPLARNLANAQDSWWMRKISPYLKDVQTGTSSAVGFRSMFR